MAEEKKKYVLTAGNHRVRKVDEKGAFTKERVTYKVGDVLELTDADAAKLVGKIQPAAQAVQAAPADTGVAAKLAEAEKKNAALEAQLAKATKELTDVQAALKK